MTKKDYVLIAGAVRDTLNNLTENDPEAIYIDDWKASYVVNGILNQLSSELKRDNPNFDKERFLTACKP